MPCFIYINGYPGIGKLTIAKELQQLLPDSKVYHNHLLIDPIDALVERSSPGYHEMRTGLRRYVLNEIATSECTKDKTWIFTDAREVTAPGRMERHRLRSCCDKESRFVHIDRAGMRDWGEHKASDQPNAGCKHRCEAYGRDDFEADSGERDNLSLRERDRVGAGCHEIEFEGSCFAD
ncbi:hypothetical protein FVEG_03601 [Fusarium verticillioides 7600]|uniref:Uncharacterized protein n=1 Tax=Gibberella moniliformis (strain M3125 / FGSC 7600) TaxID=334819 RepID=W7LQP5_GIBM7|nr:hypothetical protein FVEG_03601 [Fusarium verticillioides 7600]EWG41498.1 hypothetical protein FVEG_03601 [Fusarium verticillioides 7600]